MARAFVIAVQGIKGGVGNTSVVAHLAAALHQMRYPVAAIDLCRQNSLSLYFNLPFTETTGIATQIAQNKDWQQACFSSATGVRFFPFGLDFSIDLNQVMCQQLIKQPDWLKQNITQLAEKAPSSEPLFIILDAPRYPNIIADAAVDAADLVIDVMQSDAASYACMIKRHSYNASDSQLIDGDSSKNNLKADTSATFNSTTPSTEKRVSTPRRYLLNAYSPSHSLQRDIHDVLQNELAEFMLPFAIHSDQHIREAAAHKQNAVEGAIHSQAHRDFKLLATWCLAFLNQHADKGQHAEEDQHDPLTHSDLEREQWG